ncbi:class I SAM-dependent methyltransferase [Bradyrhizobium canariense]|uniref:Methyltransferase domain-containing protein n=1 Tax=Bradyrhizobium canariense TaxID=255045 RepID=A0A1H1QNT5_9BRAD|nr:class I SAM-dependent methyltransferase [Bradyrhizobium canariense]SDS25142.1 Methyltransferase domain-containing protein [Bradyrhizobium canariense]
MAEQQIRFDDGAAYERMMGAWSRLAGEIFLDWLAPRKRLRWIDVGCGNGAFTELIVAKNAPAEVQGIDPSDGQLAYARARRGVEMAEFCKGDATALPFQARTFDVAVMALVIFFVPEPAKGVAEMVRVVAPGGTVAAYAWDMEGGGFPLQPILTELKAMGRTPIRPPSAEASKIEALQKLWKDAGLIDVETQRIDVQRSFTDFDDFWTSATLAPTISQLFASMTSDEITRIQTRVRGHLREDSSGRVTYGAWANAIRGRVPG